MNPFELATLFVDTPPESRNAVMHEHEPLPAVALAESLQEMCYEVWTDDPKKVSSIADVLDLIAERSGNAEVRAYVAWTDAIKELVDGDLEKCIDCIDWSEAAFNALGKDHLAAKTQTSKLYALALLGRYDDAVECGLNALKIFLSHNDLYSAGKIEHNIGNLYWRRDLYRESEPYLASAHNRFTQINDQRQLAMVENCQAFVKTLQNDFREAEPIYRRALERAAANDLTVTEAEIEIGLSNLYLFKCQYDLALEYLERARRKYEKLAMRNQSANCELEIADIYLELNLLPEAIEFYKNVSSRFVELCMQAELARSSLSHARALLRLHEPADAAHLLDLAEGLYANEGNPVAAGSVHLVRSQMLLDAGKFGEAEEQANAALSAFQAGDNPRLELFARWLRAEIWRVDGRPAQAGAELSSILGQAREQSSEIEYLCRVSLGHATGDEVQFVAAAEIVEHSRSTLVSEDLRTSYFADKIAPFNELVKIKFAQKLFADAFRWHERSRSKTLADRLSQQFTAADSDEKLDEIREDLNWYNGRINRALLGGTETRDQIASLRQRALERERDYAELERRQMTGKKAESLETHHVDIDGLRRHLDTTTLVEFASIDGRVSAFVISKENFIAIPHYAVESELTYEITQLLFQIKTGRLIGKLSESNRAAALDRLRHHSRRIYDILIKPLGDLGTSKRLVFVPAGVLHYLPFQALYNGDSFLVEQFEIAYAPSAIILDRCLSQPPADRREILLAGVADALAPMIQAEIESIAPYFERSVCLLGQDVSIENLKNNIPRGGVVHLACHGKFRPDNPGFSSLSLYREDLTVNEVNKLPLENCIMVLSSCESGLNVVVRGEELNGLTRGFFAAGTSSLVMSLWRVSDDATIGLMKAFYRQFRSGKGLAESLRASQLELIKEKSHPYFWAPFVVSGRW